MTFWVDATMSIPKMSIPKMSIPIMSTVPKCLFPLGLNEIYVWFLLPTYPNFFNPTLNIKMVFGEKIPKMGTFSDFVTIFFVKCYNKI